LVVQTRFLVARARKRRSQKGPGETFWASPSSFPQRDAGAKEWPGGNGGSPHREKGNHRLFWRGECFFARAGDPLAFGNRREEMICIFKEL